MSVSAKTEYACLAVLELAAAYATGRLVQVRQITDKHGIPGRFLVQILLQLKAAGILTSTRGAAGGYALAIDPQELSLAEVMEVVEGAPANSTGNANIQTEMSRALSRAWREAAAAEREMLAATTFADLLAQVKEQTENMYYI